MTEEHRRWALVRRQPTLCMISDHSHFTESRLRQKSYRQHRRILDPASSKQAVGYLGRFASLYNLDGQAPLALASALTLPLHSETTSRASLSRIEWEYRCLTRYMKLSSHPSVLAGFYWELGVGCNLVSPSYDPIISVVEPPSSIEASPRCQAMFWRCVG
ncbi:hypothetical protein GMORB2_1741 [Geosmithia morbida]|uniref:Uncharacterized protein n=1 Tax=Geosmithia morbida TaxID=1094350 RepID=A0A9P4YUG5_9HYPO|nr:uncharacterized protein GMORB2_1741 [Geosmithia morbida]KAF4121901.1 hypothetical protein GMORB2_1741 [Geosmithia morbida]